MKIRILALVLSLSAVYSAVALGADAKHQTRRARKAAPTQPVTILDLSGPDAPTSPLPDIVRKGKL